MKRCNIDIYLNLHSFSKKMFEDILPSYLAAIFPFLSEILVHSSAQNGWNLPECWHSPSHRPSIGKWDIHLDLEGPDSERRIAEQLSRLPGDSAPMYLICLTQTFLDLYSDTQSSGPWGSNSLPDLVSPSWPIRAVEKILAGLHVLRHLALTDS